MWNDVCRTVCLERCRSVLQKAKERDVIFVKVLEKKGDRK